MSARKKRKLPPAKQRAIQESIRITLPFEEACQLISYDLTQPEDFAGQVLEVAAADIDALTELATDVESEDFVRLLQGLRTRLQLATRINDALKKAGAV